MVTLEGKRYCVFVAESSKVKGGYIPSIVIEGERGHRPLSGQGDFAAPWVWGPTFADAERAAKSYNEKLGLEERDVIEIVSSSMAASNRGRRLRHG